MLAGSVQGYGAQGARALGGPDCTAAAAVAASRAWLTSGIIPGNSAAQRSMATRAARRPPSVAPLAWTDAIVLLALVRQGQPPPVPRMGG